MFQDLLLQQEDYCRHVRSLLREIVRSVKHEILFNALALGLMQEPDMEKFSVLDQTHKGADCVFIVNVTSNAMLCSHISSSDGRVITSSVCGAVESGLIPTRVKPEL